MEEVRKVIDENQYQGSKVYMVFCKLKFTGHKLVNWAKTEKSNSSKALIRLKKERKELKESNGLWDSHQIKTLQKQIKEEAAKEEQFWRQKSRVKWLREGDNHTTIYHSTTKQRRKKNKINGLYDKNGVWRTNKQQVTEIVLDYFEKIYQSANPVFRLEDLAGMAKKVTML